MKNKSTEELKLEYQFLKILMDFHVKSNPRTMSDKELENYLNAALDTVLEIRKELKRRGVEIDS